LQIIDAAQRRPELAPPQHETHVMIEALKHAFADRARWLGDADFSPVPIAELTRTEYARALAARIAPDRTQPPESYGSTSLRPSATQPQAPASQPDDRGTSHICVVDRWGNVVALTETINGNFGSLVVAEPFGILLNNQMDDFLTVPGEANLYGLTQGNANLVAPGKRPLSSMTPTIVMKNGKPVLVIGAAGGPRIITSVAQVTLGVLGGASLEQAMSRPRLHHQWQPDVIFGNVEPPAEWRTDLERRGHQFSSELRCATVYAIKILPYKSLLGASDPWRYGLPVGLP
jgi:gamma-glutamyltranspeptidase/glutathione hydrolase